MRADQTQFHAGRFCCSGIGLVTLRLRGLAVNLGDRRSEDRFSGGVLAFIVGYGDDSVRMDGLFISAAWAGCDNGCCRLLFIRFCEDRDVAADPPDRLFDLAHAGGEEAWHRLERLVGFYASTFNTRTKFVDAGAFSMS